MDNRIVAQEDTTNINLSGTWIYRLDDEDIGIPERWFEKQFSRDNKIQLPGTTSENRIGEPLELELELSKETVRSLRQHFRFVGAAWYQRDISIPLAWTGKQIELFLERIMHESTVWVDRVEVGVQDSLSTPHRFHLSDQLVPGQTHRLTIRVDNRDIWKIGNYPSAYTDETQTIWNGIIGKMELRAFDLIQLRGVQLYPDPDHGQIMVKATIANCTREDAVFRLTLSEHSPNIETKEDNGTISYMQTDKLSALSEKTYEFTFDLKKDYVLWDEFQPALSHIHVTLSAETPTGITAKDTQKVTYGIRTFRANGTQLEINHRKVFLRGTLDCCIYPLTGYPPMHTEAWEKVFTTVKAYGLNHVRFHSWCPPEAAFTVADQLGVYLQVEGPIWMDTWNLPVGTHPEHYLYLPIEAKRIMETYGNHPSFCLFANGNELNGDFELLRQIIIDIKENDANRRVFTLTANWDRKLDVVDDLFIAQTVDGVGVRGQYFHNQMVESTQLHFEEAVSRRPVPVVSHEVGQYTVYPNMDEIKKYTGVLCPVNFEAIRYDLLQKGLLENAAKFTQGSGKLALQLYRDEIEAALRTRGLGGFQLLDLHDFPGQSTATVGILDSFWESKGLIEPEQFRQFCAPSVTLLRMQKRIFISNELFEAEAELAHYGAHDIIDARIHWTVQTSTGLLLDSGTLQAANIPTGHVTFLGRLESKCFQRVENADQIHVKLQLEGTDITNSWDVWVYSCEIPSHNPEDVLIATSFNVEIEEQLESGGKALLLLNGSGIRDVYPGKFFPVFWSPVHFVSEDPCGIYVQNQHPIFADFPTDFYSSYQWKELLEGSESICLDDFPKEVSALVQVIPNFYNNRKLANLLELRVGNGRLVVCSVNLGEENGEMSVVAKQLRSSILSYMASAEFQPKALVPLSQVKERFAKIQESKSSILSGNELAIGLPSIADSEESADFSALKGNDGIQHTLWRAADELPGHWWQVDLGATRLIKGTKVEFSESANYLYVIQVSEDSEHWHIAVNQTGQTEVDTTRIDQFAEQARYVRIVYNGLPQGIRASHKKFEVYGS
ncbi:sugar-binding domain-containing protein [Paenibacillus alba]|uniref:beta-galactosidase n=1 Tax=Paenibacillus alba TaxID=1197127 RepID=A0ABU6GD42_9BACL|nr:sugar-binding domain-containing protein [Paenibacillus alba]MEC0232132.1 discoidin domain-containing protein [Paenibacillus alba]